MNTKIVTKNKSKLSIEEKVVGMINFPSMLN